MTETRRSGTTCGVLCHCGAALYSYFCTDWIAPGSALSPLELPKHWEYVCWQGHRRQEPDPLPVQLELFP